MSHFSEKLIPWYKKNKRDLPWRKTRDPYKIWISEIMLQQTTVNAVIDYYKRWIKIFPTVESVSVAPIQKVLKLWQGLGYYRRAKNIHKAARLIVQHYRGKIPSDPVDLRKLPGFGPYTTGAVSSIAFNIPYPIVDANVRRVIMRQMAIKGQATTLHDKKILSYLECIMPKKNISSFNQGLMELGALVCRSGAALCGICPVKKFCLARKKGIQEIIPSPKKILIKKIDAVVAIIKKNNCLFIQKRGPKGLLADLWEFPGGKIKKDENPQEALRREILEELGVKVKKEKHIMNVKHFYTQFCVRLHVWECDVSPMPKTDAVHCWVSLRELHKYPMPSGSSKIFDKLLWRRNS